MDEFRESLKPENYTMPPTENNESAKKVTVRIERNAFLNLMEYISEIKTILAEMPNELLSKTEGLSKLDIEDIKDIFDFENGEGSFYYSSGKLKKYLDELEEKLNDMLKKTIDENDIEADKDEALELREKMEQIEKVFLSMLENLKEINSEEFLTKLDEESKILEAFLDNSNRMLEDIVPEDNGIEH